VNPLVILAIGNSLVWGGLIPFLLSRLARSARQLESDLERLEKNLDGIEAADQG
jgi:hypothetical protein